jgi:hypothetical protein
LRGAAWQAEKEEKEKEEQGSSKGKIVIPKTGERCKL